MDNLKETLLNQVVSVKEIKQERLTDSETINEQKSAETYKLETVSEEVRNEKDLPVSNINVKGMKENIKNKNAGVLKVNCEKNDKRSTQLKSPDVSLVKVEMNTEETSVVETRLSNLEESKEEFKRFSIVENEIQNRDTVSSLTLTEETSVVKMKSSNLEEKEEEFRGFSVVENEILNHDLVKDLSQKEETELQEMEVFIKTKAESPVPRKRRKDMEESDLSSHCSSPALSVASQLSIMSFSKRSRTGSPASRGSRRSTVDITNPKYLLPFEFGWKREVVTRSITSKEDGNSKDVYYFHPSGKKLRSLREVSEKLTPGLTIENFTFYKELLGADPQYETARYARCRGFSPEELTAPKNSLSPIIVKTRSVKTPTEVTPPVKSTSPKESLPVKEQVKPTPLKNFVRTPKETPAKPPPPKREKLVLKFNKGTPKIALKKTPAVNGERKSPKVMLPKLEGPKPHPNAPLGPKRKITPRKKCLKPQNGNKEEVKTGKPEGGDMEMGMLPPLWSPTAGSNKSSSNESLSWSHLDEEKSSNEEGRLDPCTIRCPKAMGLIPTLQCSVCLCLYHPECCDMSPSSSYRQITKYVCKNCQSKVNEAKSRNLVKHITPAMVTDKNPPIISPKPIHPGLIPSPTTPTAPVPVRMPHAVRPKLPSTKSTWLPPANSVFRSPSIPKNFPGKPEEAATPPQALVNMNNRRYIVVPKNNVLSVASNQSPSKFDPLQSTTIITPTPTSTIIQGPPLHNNPFIQPAPNSTGVVLVPFMPGENVPAEAGPHQYLVVNPSTGSAPTPNVPDLPTGSETVDHFSKRQESSKKPQTDAGNDSMQKFMRNICIGYSALLNVFQYLKVQELLRAGRVCRLWRDLASHSSLWRTVRMKNSQVSDWKGFTDSLSRHGTKHLDLRKMLMSLDDAEEMWTTFAKHISNVKCLERLDMCRCSVNVIAQIMEACPQLTVFNAQMIGVKDQTSNQNLPLESVSKMKKLKELRLKSFFGLHILGSLKALTDLADTLTILSLTSVKNLGTCEVHHIGKLHKLEALELGECSDLPETFPNEVIAKLTTLKRIRLEKGPWHGSTNEMLYQMSKLKDLIQLELINFDVRPGFEDALASCSNIKRLLLIPTYVTQSATTNNIILSGTFRLWKSLTHFVWVVTMELLKVTELFVDQCEGKGSKKIGGNSVPVLKPVPQPAVRLKSKDPDIKNEDKELGSKNSTPITVIPIDELFQMLTEALPTTKVKLLKIPFQNTWRQSITEGTS